MQDSDQLGGVTAAAGWPWVTLLVPGGVKILSLSPIINIILHYGT